MALSLPRAAIGETQHAEKKLPKRAEEKDGFGLNRIIRISSPTLRSRDRNSLVQARRVKEWAAQSERARFGGQPETGFKLGKGRTPRAGKEKK